MKLALKKAITTMNEIKNKEITDSFTKEVQKSRLKESLSEARTIKAKLEEIEISKGNWNNLIRAHAVSQEKQAQLILDFFLENKVKMEAQNKEMADLIMAESSSKLNKIKGELSTWDALMAKKEIAQISKRKNIN